MEQKSETLEQRLTSLRAELEALLNTPPGTPEQNFELDQKFFDLQTEIFEIEENLEGSAV